MEPDIEKLVKLIKRKKEKALEQIMSLYIDSVYKLAANILKNIGSKMDVEECVQDVFMDAWSRIDEFQPERGTFKTWLLILCKYKALNMRKSIAGKYVVVEFRDIHITADDNMEEQYLLKEHKDEVLSAIGNLNQLDKEIFIRRFILEQNIGEICSTLGLSRQAVDNRLWRGRKAIREMIKNDRSDNHG